MRAYIDSSVLLRVVLGEPGMLRGLKRVTLPLSSELIRVECWRTIDRARVRLRLPDPGSRKTTAVLKRLEAFDLVRIGESVLERAAEPFSTMLGSLDATHLARALLVRGRTSDLLFATHDAELATAARAVGFRLLV